MGLRYGPRFSTGGLGKIYLAPVEGRGGLRKAWSDLSAKGKRRRQERQMVLVQNEGNEKPKKRVITLAKVRCLE